MDKIVLSLTAEQQADHELNKASASKRTMDLARALQSITFYGNTGSYGPDFNPAPLYLKQATVLTREPEEAGKLVNLIQEAAING